MDYDYESLGYEKREEEAIERWLLKAKIEVMADCGKWITKTGEVINIADMSDSHLKNSYLLIKNRPDPFAFWLPLRIALEKEIDSRKENNFGESIFD